MAQTPAQRHRARVLAEEHAAKAAAIDPHGPMQGSEHQLMLATLHAHKATLKNIKAVDNKIAAKVKLLTDFDAYIDGVLQADAGAQDPVLVEVLVWQIDVGNWPRAMQLADYALRHGLQMSDRYSRDLASVVMEETAEAAIAGKLAGPDALATLAKVDQLTTGLDLHDQVRAKLHKAIGWAAMGKTTTTEVDPKQLELQPVQIALEHLTRAVTLFEKVGVKKDVERLERRLTELQSDAPT
nr:phage terminase small subunit [Delftia acidovorans]